jgi:hypothetical protein
MLLGVIALLLSLVSSPLSVFDKIDSLEIVVAEKVSAVKKGSLLA